MKQIQGVKTLEKKIKILTLLLAGSLLVNIYTLKRMEKLEQRILNQTSNLNGSVTIIESKMRDLSRNIREIKDKNKWVVTKEFKPDQKASSPDEIHLNMEWTFREVEKDARVFLLYRAESEHNWTKVSAENIRGNTYRASLILSPKKKYKYQITAEGNTFKTEETAEIPLQYYQPIPLSLLGTGSSGKNGKITSFEATFSQRLPVLFDFYKVKKAYAKMYKDDKLIRIVELKPVDDFPTDWSGEEILSFRCEDIESISKIVVKAEYMDGSVHEGEIYPEEKYMRDFLK